MNGLLSFTNYWLGSWKFQSTTTRKENFLMPFNNIALDHGPTTDPWLYWYVSLCTMKHYLIPQCIGAGNGGGGGGGGKTHFCPPKTPPPPSLQKRRSSKGVNMVCIFNPKAHNNNKNLNWITYKIPFKEKESSQELNFINFAHVTHTVFINGGLYNSDTRIS